ncbi:hypothetical protein L1987_42803 [Smallanthus sonchifolius]|uniref:Uncharacterized protein n=1 Tax=Smallanthus sonchifolius TaxID=185202 RepID=A0ACB9GLV4_9ASTR|nr:hypothetical protein L1987_42803 [Smallanthus sonchifolius]
MANAGQGESKQPAPKHDSKQPPPKQELQSQPVMEQLSAVQYCVNSPPPSWKDAVLLGFQHYILTLGTTVLIPTMAVSQMGGDNVCTNDERHTRCSCHLLCFPDDYLISWLVEKHCQVKYLSPISVVPLVTFTGLGLYHLAFPMYIPRYVTFKKPVFDRYAVLFSVSITWVCAAILTWSGAYAKSTNTCRTDCSGLMNGAPWCDGDPFLIFRYRTVHQLLLYRYVIDHIVLPTAGYMFLNHFNGVPQLLMLVKFS